MRKFYILGGIFLLFIAVAPIKSKLEQYKVQKEGEIVKVLLSKVPNTKGLLKFKYNGIPYEKSVGRSFSDDHKTGDSLLLKHLQGTDIFLLENESIEGEIISFCVLGVIGLFFIIKGLIQKST